MLGKERLGSLVSRTIVFLGMFLEESEHKDYQGILSFVILSYLVVPFQAYAAVKGFLEQSEGPWFRTPKTGRITDVITRARFFRWVSGFLPGITPAPSTNFNHIRLSNKTLRVFSRSFVVALLIVSLNISYLTLGVELSSSPGVGDTFALEPGNNGESVNPNTNSAITVTDNRNIGNIGEDR